MLIPNTFNVKAEADILVDIHSEQALIEALRMYSRYSFRTGSYRGAAYVS